MRTPWRTGYGALLLLLTGVTHAQSAHSTYKCMENEVVVYQALPCSIGAAPSTPAPPSPPRQLAPTPSRNAARSDADARRAEEARKREEIQKSFADPKAMPAAPTPPPAPRAQTGQSAPPIELLPRAVAIDRMTTYTTVIGRAIACGVADTDRATRRFSSWMDAQGLTKDHLLTAAAGIKYAADQQRAGRSPDSCAFVQQHFKNFPWP